MEAPTQRQKLMRQLHDRQNRLTHLTTLRDRRSSATSTEFDIVEHEDREVLLAAGQLHTRAENLTPEKVASLKADGWRVEYVVDLDNRLVRLWKSGTSRSGLDQLRKELRKTMELDTSIAYITPNRVIIKGDATPDSVAADEIPTRTSRWSGTPAANTIPIAILDTGIAAASRTDGWLDGLETAANRDPLDVYPTPNDYLDAAAGHGTFIAGIYQIVESELSLSIHKVIDSDGIVEDVDVAVALVKAVRDLLKPGGRLIVNLSMSTDTMEGDPPLALTVGLELVRAWESQHQGEVMLVAAAGNDGTTVTSWPAAFAATDPRVLAVAAVDGNLQPATWSTRGDWVTCSARGQDVVSTFVKGSEDPTIDSENPVEFPVDAWAKWTGTSFSAPRVAAHIAAIAQTNGSSLVDAFSTLKEQRGVGTQARFGTILDI
jgi:subtilisin family serine protease